MCNLCIFLLFLITTQMFFIIFHFSFSLLLFMLLYNINIIILSFMDLTSLLILLLSQHLISQFSSNRNWNFFLIFYRIFFYTNFYDPYKVFFFAHIKIIINISLCVISSISFLSVSYFSYFFVSFKNLRVQRNTTS